MGRHFIGVAAVVLASWMGAVAAIPSEWQLLGTEEDWELTAITQALIHNEPNNVKLKGVFILPLKDPNAFVSDDGFLIVTEGLLERLDGRDEISFVLAHELAHLIKGHPRNLERNPTRLERIRTEVERGLGGSIVGTGLQLLLNAVVSYYSREREREADAEAIRLMAKAGFSLMAAEQALKRLGDEPGLISWFRSHPFLAERMDIIKDAIRRWQGKSQTAPILTPPPNLPPEVFVELRFGEWSGDGQNLWAEVTKETQQWLWAALMDATQQGTHPFRPVRRWQRHRAVTLTLQVTPTQWQLAPIPHMSGWSQWQVRMRWQLIRANGERIADSEERFGTTFSNSEPARAALLSTAPTLARRLAKFIVSHFKAISG